MDCPLLSRKKSVEDEVAQARALCKGDARLALRVTFIANPLLGAKLEQQMSERRHGAE